LKIIDYSVRNKYIKVKVKAFPLKAYGAQRVLGG
jgi:hypothetical protein